MKFDSRMNQLGKCGLVLTAGGARGAYQVGVLKKIGELPFFQDHPSPFPIVAGASAGAINGVALATGSHEFPNVTQFLAKMWSSLSSDNVFRTDVSSFMGLATRLIKDLGFGGFFGGGMAQSLLDASPLRKFLSEHLQLEKIAQCIHSGDLYAVAITATNYYSGKSFTFIEGKHGHPVWERSRRVAFSTQITVDHICASASIPILFQPVKVQTPLGDYYFGDGGLRLVTPLSPAIRLGADRIFAIGVRGHQIEEKRSESGLLVIEENKVSMKKPPLAQVVGVVLNSIFLDHLDADVEHLKRINEMIDSSKESPSLNSPLGLSGPNRQAISKIETCVVYPSADLAQIADQYSKKMPIFLRYMLEGLGSSRADSADLMSYLNFDSGYTKDLVELGYRDASSRIDEIEQFLRTQV